MIKAEELMIGDWVMSIHPAVPRPIKVTEVSRDNIGYNNGILHISFIEPIPITPEILERNGFYWGWPVDVEDEASNVFGGLPIEMPDKSWVWDEGDGVVSVIFPNESDGGMITCYLDKHLTLVYDDMFVHELQNALKLCGISKNIEL